MPAPVKPLARSNTLERLAGLQIALGALDALDWSPDPSPDPASALARVRGLEDDVVRRFLEFFRKTRPILFEHAEGKDANG
jgi:hypothetical protein